MAAYRNLDEEMRANMAEMRAEMAKLRDHVAAVKQLTQDVG